MWLGQYLNAFSDGKHACLAQLGPEVHAILPGMWVSWDTHRACATAACVAGTPWRGRSDACPDCGGDPPQREILCDSIELLRVL